MKSPLCLLFAVALLIVAPGASGADRYFIFKAAATIPVNRVIVGMEVDKLVTKTLTSADLINLTLARPLGTKVDAKTTVLALAVVVEGPGAVAAPKSKLIVFNPDPAVSGAAKVVATVATLGPIDFEAATLTKAKKTTGQGAGDVLIAETTTGQDPVNNKFFNATLAGAAQATAPFPAVAGDIDKFTFALKSLSGPLHILYKEAKAAAAPAVDFDGIVVKGMLTAAGKPLAVLDL